MRNDCIDDRERLRLVLISLTSSLDLNIQSILNFLMDSNTSYIELNDGVSLISIECVYQIEERLFVKVVISL